jgi:asparagine synthase (glutamine-hydrolysing)
LAYAYLPGRETLVENVFEQLPGEVVRFRSPLYAADRGRLWSIPVEQDTPVNPPADEDSLRQELRRRLERAVRCRLPCGEAAGAFLSGGLDSSLVVALACRLHDLPVHTYSVTFGADYANELPFSSMVAEHCKTRHTIVEVPAADIAGHFDACTARLSDPIGDPLTVPNWVLFRRAAEDSGVVLNGEGGDPCFGGPKNLPMLLAELYGGNGNGRGFAREQSYLRAHLKCFDDLQEMLSPEVFREVVASPLEEALSPWLADPRWSALVTRLQALNVTFKGGHHILPKVDALSRPFGVVARSPLFDRRIVELSFVIPPQLKLRGSVEKHLLKEAVRDLLPEAIIDRPKSGMLVPVEAWFQGPLAAFARERLLDGLAPLGLFKRDYLQRLLDGRLGGVRPRHGAKIWLLLTLESWLRQVIGNR